MAGWSRTCSSPPISSCRSLRGPCALLYPEQGRLQLEEETPNGNSTGSANELNGTLLADFLTIGFPIFSARSVSRIFSIYTPQILYALPLQSVNPFYIFLRFGGAEPLFLIFNFIFSFLHTFIQYHNHRNSPSVVEALLKISLSQ